MPGTAGDDLPGAALAALRRVLEEVLQREPEGWRVEPIHESRPEAFDLVPPQTAEDEGALSVQEAWDVTYALHRQPGVADAEPSFTIMQDDVEELPEGEIPDEEPEALGLEALEALEAAPPVAGACQAPNSVDEALFDWSPTLIGTLSAWNQIPPAGGERFGKGIRIGHPDSGFIRHPELHDPATGETNRILAHLGFDFVDDGPDPEGEDGDHGLGTASVIMSDARIILPAGFVTGVAPEAEIVPLRVAKKRFLIPEPVLFRSGMNRLRKAIYHAVDRAHCHVISISLGWLRNKGVHEAVKCGPEQRDRHLRGGQYCAICRVACSVSGGDRCCWLYVVAPEVVRIEPRTGSLGNGAGPERLEGGGGAAAGGYERWYVLRDGLYRRDRRPLAGLSWQECLDRALCRGVHTGYGLPPGSRERLRSTAAEP